MKKFMLLLGIMLMLTTMSYGEENETEVVVSVPEFDVRVNGQLIATEYSNYPIIQYKGITYFPMTWDYLNGIGLFLNWSETLGLEINKSSNVTELTQEFLQGNYELGAKLDAIIAEYPIRVNGQDIDNAQEEYPILSCNNVTYFPMTWRYAVTEFGWETEWSDTNGFGIITSDSYELNDTLVQILASEKDSREEFAYVTIDLTNVYETKMIDVSLNYDGKTDKNVEYLVAWEGDSTANRIVSSYISGEGTTTIKDSESIISYDLKKGSPVEYGFTMDLEDAEIPLGSIGDGFGYIGVRNVLYGDIADNNPVILIMKGIEAEKLYMPYQKLDKIALKHLGLSTSLQAYYIPKATDDAHYIWKTGNIVFGDYDYVKTVQYDNHTLNILTKDTAHDGLPSLLTETTFTHMLNDVMKDNQYEFSAITNIVYFEGGPDKMRAEGTRGSQIERVRDYSMDIFFREDNPANMNNYFMHYPIIEELGRYFVHQIIHATFDDEFIAWWGIEGIAHYYMGPIMVKSGVIDQAFLDSCTKDLINYYNSEIVDKGYDIPMLLNFGNDESIESLESKYLISVHDYSTFQMNVGDHYNWSASPENTMWFPYEKGSLVFIYFDEYIKKYSSNTYDLDDALNIFLDDNSNYEMRMDRFEKIVSELTDTDFTGFFAKYVMDDTPLPLKVIDDNIVIDGIE